MFERSRSARWLPAFLAIAALSACSDVTPPPSVTAVEVRAPSDSVEVGRTLHLEAVPIAADGEALVKVPVAWSSSDESVATVDGTGQVTGKAVGTARIQATASGKSGEVTIRVVPVPVASVSVAPDTATLGVGSARRLTATARDGAGAELPGRAFAWSSDNEAVASVARDGTVTAVGEGNARITAESGGKKGVAQVTVALPPVPELRLEVVASGLPAAPAYLTAPPGDGRLFVVGLDGEIWVVQGGRVLPDLFLDLRKKVSMAGEKGMFSLAFHPRYASNGYLYVNYIDMQGDIRLERYQVSATDPNRADPASAKLVFLNHPPADHHFGGLIRFGPDGKLYIGTGDGGIPYSANGQDRGSLMGKILRIDVDGGDPYAIPSDNPYAGEPGARGEIWDLGLRNPWRWSIDAATGLLYVGDVGDTYLEEVDVVPLRQGGLNFGWSRMEGGSCHPFTESSCGQEGLVLPVLDYRHPLPSGEEPFDHPTGCSVTGGYVYRGSRMPGLRGHYFYGDYCKGWIRSFRFRDGRVTEARQWPFPKVSGLVSFGEDASGELYVLSQAGVVYRIVPAS